MLERWLRERGVLASAIDAVAFAGGVQKMSPLSCGIGSFARESGVQIVTASCGDVATIFVAMSPLSCGFAGRRRVQNEAFARLTRSTRSTAGPGRPPGRRGIVGSNTQRKLAHRETSSHDRPHAPRAVESLVGRSIDAQALMRLDSLLGTFEADAAAAFEARTRGLARGPVTRLPSLDQALGGFIPRPSSSCTARRGWERAPSRGRSPQTPGVPTLFVTCEMAPLAMLRRLIARTTGTYLGRLKSGEYDPATMLEKARQAIVATPLLAIADATRAFASPAWIRDAALAIKGDARHLLVVVDSVHSWAEGMPDADGVTEYDRLNAARSARSACWRPSLGLPILGIAERNRAGMAAGGLNTSAGSRRFEYIAEALLELGLPKKGGHLAGADTERQGRVGCRCWSAQEPPRQPRRGDRTHLNGPLQSFTEAR